MDNIQKRKGSQEGSSSAKRSRHDEGSSCTFEDELASLGEVADKDPKHKWPRPVAPKINPFTESLVFQQLEVDNYIGLYLEFIFEIKCLCYSSMKVEGLIFYVF